MSCGNPHAYPCDEAILEATALLDGELPPEQAALVLHHLEECAPCLAQHRLEQMIKGLVHRSCHEQAPEELRQRVVARIAHIQVTVTQTQGTEVFGFVVDQSIEED